MKKIFLKSAFSAIVFFGIGIIMLYIAKARSGTTATAGDKLTAAKWNEMINRLSTLETKTQNISFDGTISTITGQIDLGIKQYKIGGGLIKQKLYNYDGTILDTLDAGCGDCIQIKCPSGYKAIAGGGRGDDTRGQAVFNDIVQVMYNAYLPSYTYPSTNAHGIRITCIKQI